VVVQFVAVLTMIKCRYECYSINQVCMNGMNNLDEASNAFGVPMRISEITFFFATTSIVGKIHD
jgi:hypothetical protein